MIDLDALETDLLTRSRAELLIRLEAVSMDDVWLYEALHCDPRVMGDIGAVFTRDAVKIILAAALSAVEEGKAWVYKIIPLFGAKHAIGNVCIWESEFYGRGINEIAWTILPEFQGRGFATLAVNALLSREVYEQKWKTVHALPPVTNAASNAICKRNGFSLVEICEIEYVDTRLTCNHWSLETNRLPIFGSNRTTAGVVQPGLIRAD